MRLYLDGQPVELVDSGAEVSRALPDRVSIRTSEGTFTGVAVARGDEILVSYRGKTFTFQTRPPKKIGTETGGSGVLVAPLPGLIIDVFVTVGQAVKKGSKLLLIEAMKTQQPLLAAFDGIVKTVNVEKGDQVSEGKVLAEVEPL